MSDSWCSRLFTDGHWIFGGAARNRRISARGGLDKICREVGENAARMALEQATQAAEPKLNAKIVPLKKRSA